MITKTIKILMISIFMLTTIGVYGQMTPVNYPTTVGILFFTDLGIPIGSMTTVNIGSNLTIDYQRPSTAAKCMIQFNGGNSMRYLYWSIFQYSATKNERTTITYFGENGNSIFREFNQSSRKIEFKCAVFPSNITGEAGSNFSADECHSSRRNYIIDLDPDEPTRLPTRSSSPAPASAPAPSETSSINAKVYPNPANTSVSIEFEDLDLNTLSSAKSNSQLKVRLLDAGSNVLRSINNIKDKIVNIDISTLKKGVYFLSIEHDGKRDVRQLYVK